jgi:phospholipid/cholesterol/gamma-HCH transport system substrate-binding protein
MDLIPKEFSELAADLKKTSELFRESGVIKHLDEAIVNISTQASRAGDVMASVQKVIGDERFRQDIDASVSNIKDATATANKIADNLQRFSINLDHVGGNLDRLTADATETVRDARTTINKAQGSVDQLTRSISDRLLQVSTLLDTMNSMARKVEQGKGTAGMMVNDPRLYESMVDSAKQLNTTLADLNRLVQQWEQEGVTLKLGK